MANSVPLKRALSDRKNFELFLRIYLSTDGHKGGEELCSINKILVQC